MAENNVIVRFPPSPTGLLHVGGVRTALYNYIFAKQNGGKLLMRIEDTDKERSKKEYEDDIFDSLAWLGLTFDNEDGQKGVWRQSERTEIYKQKIQELIKKGSAYISEETEGENKNVVRFKNPGVKIKFKDLIRGDVEIDTSDLKDFVIAKNIDEPLYHLTVVVDDLESGVTHVIRGEDHISNTPRQILILEALGGERPIYAHLPLVLAEDKSKLSKRKHGESVSLKYYRDKGYEPEAILNFLALVGWNPGTDQEIFTLEELIKVFDLSKVQKKGGVFNVEKLNWLNKQHILHASRESQISNLKSQINKTKLKQSPKLENKDFLEKFLDLMLGHIHRWGEVGEVLEAGEFDYLFEKPVLDSKKITWKNQSKEDAARIMNQELEIMNKNLNQENLKKELMELAEREGKGETLWPLRYALSGRERSPDPFTLIDLLGPEESGERLQKAIEVLG